MPDIVPGVHGRSSRGKRTRNRRLCGFSAANGGRRWAEWRNARPGSDEQDVPTQGGRSTAAIGFGILPAVTSRIFHPRSARAATALAGLVLAVPVAGCGVFDSGPSARDVATSFVNAFAAGNSAAAAGSTDAPGQARAALDQARANLAPKSVRAELANVREGDGSRPATAKYNATWDLGNGRTLQYQADLRIDDTDQGWKVHWAPSVLHPKLKRGQTLVQQEQPPQAAPIFDRDGKQLMGPEQVTTVTLDKAQAGDLPGVAGRLADGLKPVDPEITQQSIVEGAGKTPPGQPYVVVSLRQADYDQVRAAIHDLPGVRFSTKQDLVSAERGYASQILSGVSKRAEQQLEANSGWMLATANADGTPAEVLQQEAPKPVQPVRTTLSDKVQRAAEQALDPVPQAAAIVAMRPSTGELLGVAQNDPADQQGPIAMMGKFPPGSTFKIATAAAGLQAGKVRADTPVPCPKTIVVDGRTIPNDHLFDLGVVPLHTAFAKSCNTTFAQLATDLPAQTLSNTAKQLGVGVDFDIPGVTTLTGQAPPGQNATGRAANGFGQGTVLASPFGMALAASTVQHGSMPTPSLIEGEQTKADAAPQPPSPDALNQLRPMMREVVTGGTGIRAQGAGEVYGKTGTAQFGDGTHAHGWFVGYRGDMAFAVLLTDAGESGPAVDVARNFLNASGN